MNSLQDLVSQLIDSGVELGKNILAAIAIYIIGRWLIKLVKKLVNKIMQRNKWEASIRSFVTSFINITLTVLLVIAVVGALGVETASFAALLASVGVAIGMALSGQLQNFAGGIIILFVKPYRLGDFIETQGLSGTVESIQMFQTVLTTTDNKTIFIPNGSLSNGTIINYSKQELRRVDWTVSIEYGEDFEKAKSVIGGILDADSRVMKDKTITIELGALADSSINLTVRAWVKGTDYWSVFFDFNKTVYSRFNEEKIGFPFPQITVHQA